MLSCEFWKIFKNIFFTEHLRATAPVYSSQLIYLFLIWTLFKNTNK